MQDLQTPDTELDRMLMELKLLRNAYRLIFLSMSISIEGAIAETLTASPTPAQPAEVREANMSMEGGDVSKQDPHTVNKDEVPTWTQKRYDAHSTSSSTRESQTSRRPSWPRGNRPTPHPAKFLRLQ